MFKLNFKTPKLETRQILSKDSEIENLKTKIIKLESQISDKDSEIDKLKSKSRKLESIKDDYYTIKSMHLHLEYKFLALQENYDYFAEWINNGTCQLVKNTFSRSKVELPLPTSEEVLSTAKFYKSIEKV